ncbi:MAG: hypothetical protein Q8L55_01960, partial [Phycisphaerales bacterium]|nr:hypothetical protein [Phycisphaerales bacterium]
MPKHAAKNTADATLERAARRAGVLTVHADGLGRTTRPPREVVQSLCDAIESGPVGDGGAVAVVIAGARSAAFTDGTHLKPGTAGSLHLQDGGTITATVASACATDSTHVTFGGPVPLGVHELALDGSPHRAFVLARPRSLNHIVRRAGR